MGVPVHVNIEEIRRPDLDAQLIADSITQQLEKRIMFRRAMKRAMQNAMRQGALGIKIMSSGRLNGASKSPVQNGIVKVVYLCILFVPTSTTASLKLRQLTASSALRFGFTKATTPVRMLLPKLRPNAKTAATVVPASRPTAVLASRPTALKASRLALRANPLPQPLLRKENKHASTKQN